MSGKKALTVRQAEEVFDRLDVDDDGKCTIQEIKKGLKAYCKEFYGRKSDAYFASLVSDWDKDNDQLVSKEEFVNDLTKPGRDAQIEEAFKEMDKDGSGKISKDEFTRVMEEYGISDDKTMDELFSNCDCDGDGQISVGELQKEMDRTQGR